MCCFWRSSKQHSLNLLSHVLAHETEILWQLKTTTNIHKNATLTKPGKKILSLYSMHPTPPPPPPPHETHIKQKAETYPKKNQKPS